MDLGELIGEWTDDLVSDSMTRVRHAHLAHYEADGEAALQDRLARFITTTLECLGSGRADPLVSHASSIARERYAAGYDISEVQTAINVIEEALWKRILSSMEPEELARALGLVNAILTLAKDTLARTYVSLATGEDPADAGTPDARAD